MTLPIVTDAEIERLFAEVICDTADVPPMDGDQIAFAARVVELALYRERTATESDAPVTDLSSPASRED